MVGTSPTMTDKAVVMDSGLGPIGLPRKEGSSTYPGSSSFSLMSAIFST